MRGWLPSPHRPTGECRGRTHPACAAGAPGGSRGPLRWSVPCTAAAASPGFAGVSSAAGHAEPGSPTAGCSCLTGRGAPTTSPAGPPETGGRGRVGGRQTRQERDSQRLGEGLEQPLLPGLLPQDMCDNCAVQCGHSGTQTLRSHEALPQHPGLTFWARSTPAMHPDPLCQGGRRWGGRWGGWQEQNSQGLAVSTL